MTTKKSRFAVLTVLLVLITGLIAASSTLHRKDDAARAAEFLKFDIPALAHGFQKSPHLPDAESDEKFLQIWLHP